MTGTLKGFSAPLDPTGQSSLYGPPPWNFSGRSVTLIVDCDQRAIGKLVPKPLTIIPDSPVRFTIHELICDIGFGTDFAARHPERCLVREAVVALAVQFEGVEGFYDPFLYCDSAEEITVGREMFGWPQLDAKIWITPPDPVYGARVGDRFTGKVQRKNGPVLSLTMEVDNRENFDRSVPAFSTFYTMRIIPDPTNLNRTVEIFQSHMSDISIEHAKFGQGELNVFSPELKALKPEKIGAARCNAIKWTKNRSKMVHSQIIGRDETL